MDETTSPTGPSLDGIMTEARSVGAAFARGALALQGDFDPMPMLRGCGVEITLHAADIVTVGGIADGVPHGLNAAEMARLAGLLMGIADTYRVTKKDPLS